MGKRALTANAVWWIHWNERGSGRKCGKFVIGDERNGNRVREFIILGVAIWLESRTYGGCEEPLRRWGRG